MTSVPTIFKLSKRDGLTRRITFSTWPDWKALATKIESLYNIPFDKIGVSYVDSDGDEVTLSSQEELEDFKQTSFQPASIVKFTVQDFRVQLSDEKALPETPRTRSTNARNTFGPDGLGYVVGIDDDWQPLGTSLFIPKDPILSGTTTPHAYVETVDDDDGTILPKGNAVESDNSSTASSGKFSAVNSSLDKGKAKAEHQSRTPTVGPGSDSDGISSTASLLAEDTPSKPPVHVYDIGVSGVNKSGFHVPSHSSRNASSRGDVTPVQAESTPKVLAQSLNVDKARSSENAVAESAPDPPLPSIDTPSLSNDVASLLNTLTTVFASHPELSESLRHIIQNASNGTYWAAHREAITNAAQELVRTAEATGRAAEEEAGRRVAEAVGGIVKSLADVTGAATSGVATTSNAPSPARSSGTSHPPFPHWGRHPWGRGWHGGFEHRPFGFAYSRPRWPDGPAMFGRAHPNGPPPPPDMLPPPPPPPPAYPPMGPPGPFPPYPPVSWTNDHTIDPASWDETHEGRLNHEESRAQVEAAKMYYKAEKERYRQEREERRKEKERLAASKRQAVATPPIKQPEEESKPNPPPKPQTPPLTQIVSNARGPYPELQMYSVPRRHHTHLGHGHRRGASSISPMEQTEETSHARSLQRITKRLADMGFTENAYPLLPAKIKTNMPQSGPMTKDKEDDIVTTLLEEMLAMSPKPPTAPLASGSASGNVPGGWN